jgi:hypothetical protein
MCDARSEQMCHGIYDLLSVGRREGSKRLAVKKIREIFPFFVLLDLYYSKLNQTFEWEVREMEVKRQYFVF